MPAFAPRIAPELLAALVRLDDRRLPIAELNRRLGEEAERRGLTRPSYERVRELVHLARLARPVRRGPSTLQILLEAGAGYRGGYAAVIGQIAKPREERR